VSEPVEITSLAAGGAGVGRLSDGMTVFVPRTVAGDLVRLADVKRHRRHALARLAEVVSAGPGRVDPPCDHFVTDRCGGCQWLHVAAEAQAAAKRRIVGDALRRIAKLDLPDPQLVPAPRRLGYRSVITVTVRRQGGRVWAGFHDAFDPDRVFALEHCAIAREEVQLLWEAIRVRLDVLPPGDDVRLRLRVTEAGGLHLVVSGGERAFADGEPLAEAARAAGLSLTVWWQPSGGAARRVGGEPGDAAETAFAQVNEEVARVLHDAAVAAAGEGLPRPSRVVDLYAGAGATALPLAAAGHDVTLVESDQRAVRRASELATRRGIRLRAIAGRVEDHLALLRPGDVVLANPPRTGLGKGVAARLLECPPRRLVYVSCDPATLARDLVRAGVTTDRIREVRAFDIFPQTSHVETMVVAGYPAVEPRGEEAPF
jgi:23S rRNA (uracil1939-C5)-methyltransferase